jgi:hypothetical protein
MIFGACPEAPIVNSCVALRLRARPNMRFVPIKDVEACRYARSGNSLSLAEFLDQRCTAPRSQVGAQGTPRASCQTGMLVPPE